MTGFFYQGKLNNTPENPFLLYCNIMKCMLTLLHILITASGNHDQSRERLESHQQDQKTGGKKILGTGPYRGKT